MPAAAVTRSLPAAAVVAAILAAVATDAAASPTQDLERARQSFRAHDYLTAHMLATYRSTTPAAQPVDLVEAHVILGASDFETGNRANQVEFEKALQIQPKTLTDLLFSEGAIRLFDQTKADSEARAERDAQLRKLADERERIRKYRESLVVVERRSFGVNFVPFGAGQFQNKQPTRGLLFATGQGISAGISIGIFVYLAGKYGIVANVPNADVPGVRQLHQVGIGAGVAFYALYAWGVVDALLHYKPRVQVEGDDSLLPPLTEPDARKPRGKTSVRDRLHLAPLLSPTGAGLGLTWEND
jgi:hypothetical protein